jgi:polysaccharide deacetylase 2 family uncharacterized protein YibQ
LFQKIEPKECLNQAWSKDNREEKAKNIFNIINWFNKFSNWVGSEIVKTSNLESRIELKQKLIEIADELFYLNNFNGVFAICSGMTLAPIYRIKNSW